MVATLYAFSAFLLQQERFPLRLHPTRSRAIEKFIEEFRLMLEINHTRSCFS